MSCSGGQSRDSEQIVMLCYAESAKEALFAAGVGARHAQGASGK